METKSNSSRMPLVLLRSALVGSALGVALVALFALVLQKQWLGIDSVPYVNSAIKIVSAAAAALIAARKAESRTLLWGAAAGGLYMLISYVVFSLVSGSFSFDTALVSDLAMCMLAGAITGVVRNLKR